MSDESRRTSSREAGFWLASRGLFATRPLCIREDDTVEGRDLGLLDGTQRGRELAAVIEPLVRAMRRRRDAPDEDDR